MPPPAPALAPWAASEATSRGRAHPEPRHAYRSEYQRDRDRILHSTAFRRLVYKTQVFVNHEGDLYRTRLTHSLEVAQIARTVALRLGLNEQLTEAICLAHDLGHTPFGHAGQEALNRCMRPWGGFEHNLQSLRVVDLLEERYLAFPGLNLTFETREGILKHCSLKNARNLGELGERFGRRQPPGLEAQLSNIADEIAYNNHDVDDGLRAGLLTVEDLAEVALFAEFYRPMARRRPRTGRRVLVHEAVRRMVDYIVTDLIDTTARRIARHQPRDSDAVRALPGPIVGLSREAAARHLELKRFLGRRLYRHPRVLGMTRRAREVVAGLFACYLEDPARLPREHAGIAARLEKDKGRAGRARAVADYVAGMTDRYAISAYRRLVEPTLDW